MPDDDLVALWDAHIRTEFETRDVDGTMAAMIAQPYVKHIPMMTARLVELSDNGHWHDLYLNIWTRKTSHRH